MRQSFKLLLKTGTHDIVSEAFGVKILHKRGCTLQVPIPFSLMYEDYVLPDTESIGKAVKDVMAAYGQIVATIKLLKINTAQFLKTFARCQRMFKRLRLIMFWLVG